MRTLAASVKTFLATSCVLAASCAALQVEQAAQNNAKVPRVAIVGSGIGGATVAYYLAQSTYANITVFEAEGDAGGRTQEAVLGDGSRVELGGSIGIMANKHLVHFTDLLGLKRIKPTLDDSSIGVWAGHKFAFQSDGGLWSQLQGFARYKLSPFATDRLVQKAVHRFGRIYGLQRSGTSFDTSAELWRALDLDWATNITLASYLMSAYPSVFGVSLITERYINEVAAALTRVNYNQSPQLMSALAGLIGLAPDDTTFMVQGGMSQVAQGLLKLSNATVHLSARVTRVARPLALHGAQQHRHWEVQVAAGGNSTEQHDFDIVVIATPMSTSGIQVQGAPKGWPPPQPYQTVHTSFVRGGLRAAYFGNKHPDKQLPAFIGTTASSRAPFSSISLLRNSAQNGTALYKMFSIEAPRISALPTAFDDDAVVLAHKRWKAYPRYDPPEALGPFRVDHGLYYTSAIEAGASCIEISAVAGANVAMLIASNLRNGKRLRMPAAIVTDDMEL